jgi:NADP-dependent 3-hydroxy acid dehydrogenase YdfG
MDKVILVTGASSGIGEAIARELAARGAKVLMGARRSGADVATVSLDVTEVGSMQAFAQTAVDLWGRIDVLVNNAGVMPLSPLSALKLDEWEQMVDVNIKGVLWGIAAVLPIMERQSDGQIINIGSIGALRAVPTAAVYCGTKFAVRAISDGFDHHPSGDARADGRLPRHRAGPRPHRARSAAADRRPRRGRHKRDHHPSHRLGQLRPMMTKGTLP